jgi:phosphoserine aminotransferase
MTIIEVSQTADITGVNQFIVCDSSGPITISLTRAALGLYYGYTIKNIGSGTVTVTPVLNDLIDGVATKDLVQYEAIQIIDYKTNNWIIIADNHV